ncbi:MAG TPA: polyphosphate kinase 1, partial [Candidatus Methylomirabilis sp.]|nr:polyphosphate kinase 1 [Candidatus Methylomirabilis sp.]
MVRQKKPRGGRNGDGDGAGTTSSSKKRALPLPVPQDASQYLNRELSLLAFSRRVLEEAQDERNPLLERVKFLGIVGSNLAEFFMVRVAGLKQQMEAGVVELSSDGL